MNRSCEGSKQEVQARIQQILDYHDATGNVDSRDVVSLLGALVAEIERLSLERGYGLEDLIPPAKEATEKLRKHYAKQHENY